MHFINLLLWVVNLFDSSIVASFFGFDWLAVIDHCLISFMTGWGSWLCGLCICSVGWFVLVLSVWSWRGYNPILLQARHLLKMSLLKGHPWSLFLVQCFQKVCVSIWTHIATVCPCIPPTQSARNSKGSKGSSVLHGSIYFKKGNWDR